jgi:hypothetical protein
VLPN